MDNRFKLNGEKNDMAPNISSDKFINKFKGVNGLAEALCTNLKTGINGSKQDIQER